MDANAADTILKLEAQVKALQERLEEQEREHIEALNDALLLEAEARYEVRGLLAQVAALSRVKP